MSDSLDLTGVWYGRYASSWEENGFIAVLDEIAGAFTGTISEPNDEGEGGIRHATVAGRRTGQALFFVKQYTGRWTHAVHYAGRIDSEGTEVTGSWNLFGVTGGFDMQREKFSEEELEAEEEAEILIPATVDWRKEWK